MLQEHHGQCAAQGDNPQNQHQQRDEQIIASDDEDVVDNVFADGGPNQRGRRNNAHGDNQEQRVNQPIRWEASFKSDIPEFQGTLNLEDFIDWLNMVEEILEFRQVPDDARVSMVVTHFKGQAMAWWQQLKESRRQANKACINSWDRLTKHMRRGFLPFNYERTLYNKLQNLRQGTRSVDEYATEFFYMTARMTTSATQQQLISRFIGGLRYQLQVALAQFNPSTVSKAHQRAVSMELQLRSLGSSTSRARFTNAFASDTIVQSTTDGTQTRSDTPKTGTNTYTIANSCPPCTNALRCFTCGERRHIQTSYPNKTRHGLVIQEAEDDEPQYDNYENDPDESTDALHGDVGLSLVVRRNCLVPKALQESWLRTNLFRSTCTINGRVCKLIIDSGSCANVISQDAVTKLGLVVQPHPSPYTLAWLNNGTKINVSQQVGLTFSIGHYKDTTAFDVVPMDACHLLLGRPWQFYRDAIHRRKANTYSFLFGDRTVTLLPPKEQPEPSAITKHDTPKTALGNTLLTVPKAEFEKHISDGDIMVVSGISSVTAWSH